MGWKAVHRYLYVDAGPGGSGEMRLAGEIDLNSHAAALRVIEEVAARTSGQVTVELSRVTFIDAAGLRALLRLREQFDRAGRRFVIRMPNQKVRRLIDLTGMTGEFSIEWDRPSEAPKILHFEAEAILDEALEGLLRLAGTDKGNAQLVDPASGGLRIITQQGFDHNFLSHFEIVHDRDSSCGLVLREGRTVAVSDVTVSPIFAGTPSLEAMMDAKVQSVISTPLTSRAGRLIGVISAHHDSVREWQQDEIRHIRQHAAIAAQIATVSPLE